MLCLLVFKLVKLLGLIAIVIVALRLVEQKSFISDWPKALAFAVVAVVALSTVICMGSLK